MSRPTLKTQEMQKGIINLIIAGHNITAICSLKGMPGRSTIHRWLLEDPDFFKGYKKAVSLRAHETLLDVLAIADRPKQTSQDIAADRLRVSARLRIASMLNPSLKRTRKKTGRRKDEFRLPDKLELNIVRPENENEGHEEGNGCN